MTEAPSEPKARDVFDLDAGVAEAKRVLLIETEKRSLRVIKELRECVVREIAELDAAAPGTTTVIAYGPRMQVEVSLLMQELNKRGYACTNHAGRTFKSLSIPSSHCQLKIARRGEPLPFDPISVCVLL